jgi:predicted Fe-Mo cluster-binding NifX family protein
MKIALSTLQNNLDAQVDTRFGRAPYFLIVDTGSMEYEVVINQNLNATGGVGIQSAQLLADKGVKAVLTGKCGPKAFRVFAEAEIEIYEDVSGTVREAVESFGNELLRPSRPPDKF